MVRAGMVPELDLKTFPSRNDVLERSARGWCLPSGGYAGSWGRFDEHGRPLRAVSHFPSKAVAEALRAEFYRVPSSPVTRTYLNEVLESLMRLLAPLSREALEALADDEKLSVKWRRR